MNSEMRLFDFDGYGGEEDLGMDMDDAADDQELQATAYRFVQIIPDRCEELAKKMAYSGMNHPVVFLCDVSDPFGLAIARKVSTPELIGKAMTLKSPGDESHPAIIEGLGLGTFESREPTIFHAIKGRMTGLIGYFPIVVAAKAGFSVFPWPYSLKEKSKFELFSRM